MARAARLVASATVGSLIVLGAPMLAWAQTEPASPSSVRTSATRGAILGTVKDDHDKPIANVVVSAVGGTTTIAVTDKNGQFGFSPLAPGPYLLIPAGRNLHDFRPLAAGSGSNTERPLPPHGLGTWVAFALATSKFDLDRNERR